ncbi:MAG TPA: hypothetical protein VGL81_16160 [Polyangiaceae bacterium]|jgi:hypothetical protein
MARDELVAGALLLAFAVVVTAHVTLVVGLAGRAPRWRGLVALVVPPLAPYWGWAALRGRAVVWIAAAVAYGVLRIVANR